MKTNEGTKFEEKNQNESTILDEGQVKTEVVEEVVEEAVEEKGKGNGWKQVVVGGMSGIMLGAAGALFSGFTLPEDEEAPGTDPTDAGHAHPQANDTGIAMATGVNDGMSFSEAFAAARHEVGAGGAFVWHGNVYGTYYAGEWNSMSPDQQHAFTAQATGAHVENHAGVDVAVAPQQVNPTRDNIHTTSQPEIAENHQQEVDVHVLGVEQDAVMDDGSVVNVAVAQVGGHAAMFMDVNNDHVFDVVAVDVDDNGQLSANEVGQAYDPNLTVENFLAAQGQQSTDPSDAIYANTPDYMNDADVAGFNA